MQKEEAEDDEYYDRTMERKHVEDESKATALRNESKQHSYEQLKEKLSNLLEEKQEINDQMMQIASNAVKELSLPQQSSSTDELDNLLKEEQKAITMDARKACIEKMKSNIAETDQ